MKATRKTLKPSQNRVEIAERAATVLGVPGRFGNAIYDAANGLFVNQRFIASRPFSAQGFKKGSQIYVELRFDDECKNGSQSFAITGHVIEPGARDWAMGGCIHDELKKYFPEFAHLIKFHGSHTFGPWYYFENTLYMADTRDSSGKYAGEPSAWDRVIKFGEFPITQPISKDFAAWLVARREFNSTTAASNPARLAWEPRAVEHAKKPGETYEYSPNYTLNGYDVDWYKCPFKNRTEAEQFCEALARYPFEIVMIPTAFSKGKERELDKARSSAIWPDATDEQLSVPREELKAALLARLPGLVAEFRAAMDAIGFEWREIADDESASNE